MRPPLHWPFQSISNHWEIGCLLLVPEGLFGGVKDQRPTPALIFYSHQHVSLRLLSSSRASLFSLSAPARFPSLAALFWVSIPTSLFSYTLYQSLLFRVFLWKIPSSLFLPLYTI
ncbi:hypothetical protein ASPTUDRAFT_293734 [Aspergillus tubingensis CBS 134.48]|uniref:Uncharacterized protein n=1 Tax=Aspergillus tubingensis (strain CBS 134.48) TaxID=767770 RepID=A0A1L9NPD2_ASPTC|nr:hypothetical protein ASPTUDRAFT_293734 [Aspergillus tubingensis CBS 134.48]